MPDYSLLFISHGDSFSEASRGAINKFVTQKLGLNPVSTRSLSKAGRVIDYIVNMEDEDRIAEAVKYETLEGQTDYDIILQQNDKRKNRRLFVFDMDSTLIYQEVIELIASYARIEDKVSEITTRAMNGELDFNESLKERVRLLKGIDATHLWEELKEKIVITKGAKNLCKALKNLGCTLGVCSGGFIPLAEYIKQELGLDYAFANRLNLDEKNCLDGTTKGTIVNGERKAELLLEIANKHQIQPSDAVAVGDGANDLLMMSVAGFGIAWHAKPKVRKAAPCALNTDSLQDILYILGYTDDEIEKLV